METTLLATKLVIPPLALGFVPRPRLVQRLQAILSTRLTLVSAPAGFGKTTLLSEWIHGSTPRLPVAWLSLEEAENDPARFWQYFMEAVSRIAADAASPCLSQLGSQTVVPIEDVLTTLINGLAASVEHRVLVVDDYHSIQSASIHRGISFLVEHLPPVIHLVIATRLDPPLPLARLRGSGVLLEIGADDLRFTTEEAGKLLRELGGPALSDDHIRALGAKTEGWAAGLKMAVLSMHGERDIGGFIAGFTGSQRYVMDYLIEEVLQRQSTEVRSFLLQTSVLDRLTGGLCDAVAGSAHGTDLLIALWKENLFVNSLDMSCEWFRYHHLFRDLLRHRLRAEKGDDEVQRLHLKAAAWCEGHGHIEEAINHALSGHDWDRAMDLVGRPEVVSRVTRSVTMLNWLQRIPEQLLKSRAQLYLQFAWALEGAARYNEAEACLDYLDSSVASDAPTRGRAAILRTFIASDRGDFQGTERHARRALEILPKDDVGVSLVSGPLAGIYVSRGRFAEAEPLIRSNYEAIRRAGNINNAVLPLTYIGLIRFLKGNLHEAVDVYREAIDLAARNPNTATVCLAHLYLGLVYYEWNNLEEASSKQQLAIDTFQSSRIFGSMELDTAYLYLARTRAAMADFKGASTALDSADRVVSGEAASPLRMARNAAFHAVTASLMGDAEAASRWVDALLKIKGLEGTDACFPALHLVLARMDKVAANEMLAGMYNFFATQGLRTYMVAIRALQALNSAEMSTALVLLGEALAMGKPESFMRAFADLGTSLAPLLRQATSRGGEGEYAGELLGIIQAEDRRRREHQDRRVRIPQSSESLSEREMEVLRLVAAGLSNHEITERLHISLNTVKRHIYNVSQRLQVGSRTQAVARARELKLL